MAAEQFQFLYEGEFARSQAEDAKDFSKYVAGKHRPPPYQDGKYLTGPLHLEMKAGRASVEQPARYQANDVEGNVWRAMANRATVPQGQTGTDGEGKKEAFAQIRAALPTGEGCQHQDFDKQLLSLILSLRDRGLAAFPQWAAKPPWRPPELGTVGLAQRLVNHYYEYELSWALTQRPDNATGEPPAEDLTWFIPYLHAPIHVTFLRALDKLPIGQWLTQREFLRQSKILDGHDAKYQPWWKLDCPRTYYGLQILFRRIAMSTWLPNITQDEIANMADESLEMFNQAFPQFPAPIPDLLDVATNTHSGEVQAIIDRTARQLRRPPVPRTR